MAEISHDQVLHWAKEFTVNSCIEMRELRKVTYWHGKDVLLVQLSSSDGSVEARIVFDLEGILFDFEGIVFGFKL